MAQVAAYPIVVTGTFTANTQASQPWEPFVGKGFNISIEGVFSCTVALQRSFDQGTTWHTVASYAVPTEAQATEVETGVLYQLATTAFTSGTVNYRASQRF